MIITLPAKAPRLALSNSTLPFAFTESKCAFMELYTGQKPEQPGTLKKQPKHIV
ncbi:hypothetical protein ACIOHH_04075 [Streptomyces microflavus]|uniref:hypothetical protein n=1 Tax=Streptomyces microflavus TaxID=1919 RepID=UPI0037F14A3B